MLLLRPCIITLLIVYPVFLAAGVWLFRYMVRTRPHRDVRRNKSFTILRFLIYVVLSPLGCVLALAILGWLDPLYHLVRRVF